jgi:general secretion pathway protein A
MYRKFFGLDEKPFEVTPDPSFLYSSPSHDEILASLIYGIQERRGFIVIVGEVGTGKTTLLNAIIDRFDENTTVANIFNTDVSFEEMLRMALVDLGILNPDETLDKVEAIHRLNEFAIQQLATGGNVVLIIDEAQNLDRRSLENLRLLSNLETPKHKLLQIILSGQPELDEMLGRKEMRQLSQRISIKRYLSPLNEKETYKYIRHRLIKANCKKPSLFSRRALKLIWEYSQGIPRKINNLCDNALLIGYGLGKNKIRSEFVTEAVNDLGWNPLQVSLTANDSVETTATQTAALALPAASSAANQPLQAKPRSLGRRFAWAASLMLLGGLIFLCGLFWDNFRFNISGIDQIEPAGTTLEPPNREQSLSPSATNGNLQPIDRQELVSTQGTSLLESGGDVQLQTAESNHFSKQDSVPAKPQKKLGPTTVPLSELELPEIASESESQNNTLKVFESDNQTDELSAAKRATTQPYIVSPKPQMKAEAAPETEVEQSPSLLPQEVVVKRGDTLMKIIKQNYGTYRKETLLKVLSNNPEIRDINRINVGQVIKLPRLN